MNYNLTLKDHVENLTNGQGHDLIPKGHVAYQWIRIVAWTHPLCFHRSNLSVSKVVAEKLLVSIYFRPKRAPFHFLSLTEV